MSQLGLFEPAPVPRERRSDAPSTALPRSGGATSPYTTPPRARRTDPTSSHVAADAAERFISGHKERIVAAVCAHPGATAHQIALATGLSVEQIDRRVSELEAAGWITRPDKQKVMRALRLYPTERARRQFGPRERDAREGRIERAILAGEQLARLQDGRRRAEMEREDVIRDGRLS